MQKKNKSHLISTGLITENRKARFNYSITETVEAGLSLTGGEVKSLRQGKANITDGFAIPDGNSFLITNVSIGKYSSENPFASREDKRPRRLLLNKREIKRLIGLFNEKRFTIVPLKLYFNEKGLAKLLLGVGTGKLLSDKRQTIKDRDWKREQGRLLKK